METNMPQCQVLNLRSEPVRKRLQSYQNKFSRLDARVSFTEGKVVDLFLASCVYHFSKSCTAARDDKKKMKTRFFACVSRKTSLE
jgi:hypothetical protein